MSKLKLFIVIILLSGMFCGCEGPSYFTEKIVADEIIGDYQANFKAGLQDVISLKADSTFVHTFMAYDSTIITNSGRYRFMGQKQFTLVLYGFEEIHEPKYYNDLSRRDHDVSQALPLSCYKNKAGIFLTYSFGKKLNYVKVVGD